MSEKGSSGHGIGFVGLLTILFVGLKLTHYIDWGWVWVLSPMWLSPILWLLGIFIIVIVLLLIERFE